MSDIVDLTARLKPGAPNRPLVGAPADAEPFTDDDRCAHCGARWYRVTCIGGCGAAWTTTRPPDGAERCPNCPTPAHQHPRMTDEGTTL